MIDLPDLPPSTAIRLSALQGRTEIRLGYPPEIGVRVLFIILHTLLLSLFWTITVRALFLPFLRGESDDGGLLLIPLLVLGVHTWLCIRVVVTTRRQRILLSEDSLVARHYRYTRAPRLFRRPLNTSVPEPLTVARDEVSEIAIEQDDDSLGQEWVAVYSRKRNIEFGHGLEQADREWLYRVLSRWLTR